MQQRHAVIGDDTGVGRQLDVTFGHHRIGKRDAEVACEMIVTVRPARMAASRGPVKAFIRRGSESVATCMMLSSMRATAGVARRW